MPSRSSVRAELPENVKIDAAPAGTPDSRAKLLGKWSGWMCRDATGDTKAAFERIEGNEIVVVYAFANSALKLPAVIERLRGKFSGDEVHVTLQTDNRLAYRLRPDGNLDVMWRQAAGTAWCSGVLQRQ